MRGATSMLYSTCHYGNKKAFSYMEIAFYGAGLNRGLSLNPEWINIILDRNIRPNIVISNINPANLSKFIYPTIEIEWEDFDVPDLPKDFWTELKEFIISNKKDVLFCCLGGHGRTGTALAIMAGLLKLHNNPVEFIRKNYCCEAIETLEQIEYIREITGLSCRGVSARQFFRLPYEDRY